MIERDAIHVADSLENYKKLLVEDLDQRLEKTLSLEGIQKLWEFELQAIGWSLGRFSSLRLFLNAGEAEGKKEIVHAVLKRAIEEYESMIAETKKEVFKS